jgi:hypothetical protein
MRKNFSVLVGIHKPFESTKKRGSSEPRLSLLAMPNRYQTVMVVPSNFVRPKPLKTSL